MEQMNAHIYAVGPQDGTVLVRTARDGLAARVGHDLVIEVTRWIATLRVPDCGAEGSSITATFDARSLEVREGTGGAIPLSAKDIADIRRNALEKVLQVDANPEMMFESTALTAAGPGRVAVAGTLTIGGVARPVRFVADLAEDGDITRVTATVPVVQSEWGIKPFRAFMGALKVRDQVDVAIDIRVPTGEDRTREGHRQTSVRSGAPLQATGQATR